MPLIIEHNCGHETKVNTTSTAGTLERTKVAAMCPPCEQKADQLTCTLCGNPHPAGESTIVMAANASAGAECLKDRRQLDQELEQAKRRIIPG